jgi:glycerol-3-phosphate responsive antiterminator
MSYESEQIIGRIRNDLLELERVIDQNEQDIKVVEKNYDDLKDEVDYIQNLNKSEMEKSDGKVLAV